MPGEVATSAAAASGPRGQLQEVQWKSDRAADDSMESTRRMLKLCEESHEVGMKTLVMLDEQGEQLDRVEEGADQINADMREAEKNLTGMEKCCGICVVPCGRGAKRKFKENGDTWRGACDDGKVVVDQPQHRVGAGGSAGAAPGNSSGYVAKITNDARETEMEDNMGQVNCMISTLRNMAIDMGSEVDNQNRQIDRVNSKVESNDNRIQRANERTHQLIK